MPLPTRRIGARTVSAQGLGCMPMSWMPMMDKREQALATIHRALDLGITFLDTANVYCPTWDEMGHNEILIAEAFRTYTGPADVSSILVATKGGLTRSEGDTWGRDASLDGLRAACEKSLRDLGTSTIDLYQLHRTDPRFTVLEQMQVLLALHEEGLVATVGLSNFTLPELDVAIEVLGTPGDGCLVSVQNEFSPRCRVDADVLTRCEETGIAFLPWSPLGGARQAHEIGSHYSEFAQVGDETGFTAQEVVLAWLLSMSPAMIPIPGATRPETVASIVRAFDVHLTDEQFDRLQAVDPLPESVHQDGVARSPLR
jgi:aryl-alcohol dehydrogenase-like predicted oxidoreductase